MRKNKTWEITLTDNSRLVANEPIENAVVYTTDTEAYLNFRVIDSGFDFDSATIAMLNKDDGSIVERPMSKEVETAVYEIESDIIPHFGLWQAQVLFKQGDEIFTSTPVTFVIERYMMAEQPPRLEDVVSWKRLYDNATETINELTRINDELTNTNETVQQAEAQRVLAENERSEKYGSYAQQFNDVITDLSEEKDYHSLPEISAARGGHDTLGERLDDTTAQLTKKANKGEVREATSSQPILLGELHTEVKEAMTGGSVAVVGEDTVGEENLKDEAVTSLKRTALGEWGAIICDQNAFVNFDFENGQIIFDKSQTEQKDIRVVHRKTISSIGSRGVTNTIAFANSSNVPNMLTYNTKSYTLNVYASAAERSSVGEDEIFLATWIGNDPESVVCNVNNLLINGIEPVSTDKRTVLGDNSLVVINSEKMVDFDFVDRVVRFPSGEKKVFWRNQHYDLSSEEIEIPIDTNTTYKMAGIYFDTNSKSIMMLRTSNSFESGIKQTMILIGGLYHGHDGTGSGFLFGHSVTNNGTFNLPSTPEPTPVTENNIYGIRYDINSPNPVVERVEASIGLTAEISIDNAPVTNHFDNIYPWSHMKICNLKETDWGAKKVVYKGEEGFTFDGSNGDVMVEIPKHYMKRYREGNYEYILISGTSKDGFSVDPAFVENGKELEKMYVGRYEAYSDKPTRIIESKSGTVPTHITVNQFKNYLGDKVGYGATDWRTRMMLQRLFLVEFATRDSQSIMGGFSRLVFFGKSENYAQLSETNTNRIIVGKGYDSDKFRVGHTAIVSATQTSGRRKILEINDFSETQYEIIFSGDPIDITEGVEQISNVPQESGSTDYIEYPSGRQAGDRLSTAFQYRGIENLWGNKWEYIEGIRIKDLVFEYSNSMWGNYEEKLSFKAPLQNQIPGPASTVVYAKEMGMDNLNPHIMLPIETGTETAGFDYWCDGFYSYDSGEHYAVAGGGWDHFERGGLFAWRFWQTADTLGELNGGRITYKPI